MLGRKTNRLRQHVLGVKKDFSSQHLGNKVENKNHTSAHHHKSHSAVITNNLTDEEKQREPKGLNSRKQIRNQNFYN